LAGLAVKKPLGLRVKPLYEATPTLQRVHGRREIGHR